MRADVYLDWNATTPPHGDVLAAMAEAAASAWGNPASVHGTGRRARALVEDARAAVAALIGRDERDVILTGGGTEANNLALAGAPALVTSRLEHPSITRVAEELGARGGLVRWLPVASSGRIEPADVDAALRELPSGALVALAAVNHETGVIQPVAEVAALAQSRGARLHVDAVQAVGRLPPESFRCGDSIAVASHKIRGPKGIGALAMAPGRLPRPVLFGGSQERGLRPGTVDAVAAAGFRTAARRALETPARYAGLAVLRDALERELSGVASVNGAGARRAPHVSSLAFAGVRGDELAAALDLEGVHVSSGSACTAGTSEPSAVISAMLGPERARSTLRVSLGEDTTARDVDALLSALQRVLARARRPSSNG